MNNQKVSELVDTHCHLNFDTFNQDRRQVVEQARDNGINRILIPGIDIETSKTAIAYANEYNEVYASVGIHPNIGSTLGNSIVRRASGTSSTNEGSSNWRDRIRLLS